MNKGITQRQAFSHLMQGKKIRRRRWEDDDWIQYVNTGDSIQLHARWTAYPYDGGQIAKDIIGGLLAWDDWELVDDHVVDGNKKVSE